MIRNGYLRHQVDTECTECHSSSEMRLKGPTSEVRGPTGAERHLHQYVIPGLTRDPFPIEDMARSQGRGGVGGPPSPLREAPPSSPVSASVRRGYAGQARGGDACVYDRRGRRLREDDRIRPTSYVLRPTSYVLLRHTFFPVPQLPHPRAIGTSIKGQTEFGRKLLVENSVSLRDLHSA